MMEEAEEEHHVVDVLAKEIKRLAPSNPDYDAKFKVLTENVKHHIEEEEGTMLPKAKALGKDELNRLGEEMAARKDRLLKSKRASRASRPSSDARPKGRQDRRQARQTRIAATRKLAGRSQATSRRQLASK